MRSIARFMDARNTAEGKFLSVLLSVLLVFSFLNVGMFTDQAGAVEETNSEFVNGEPNDPVNPQNETVVPAENDSDEEDVQESDTNEGVNEEPASQEGVGQNDSDNTPVATNELSPSTDNLPMVRANGNGNEDSIEEYAELPEWSASDPINGLTFEQLRDEQFMRSNYPDFVKNFGQSWTWPVFTFNVPQGTTSLTYGKDYNPSSTGGKPSNANSKHEFHANNDYVSGLENAHNTNQPVTIKTVGYVGAQTVVLHINGNNRELFVVNLTPSKDETLFTVAYTDGVEDIEIFPDQVYSGLKEGAGTPTFSGDVPTRDGYTFEGWAPAIALTVTGNTTYVAQWEKNTPEIKTFTVVYTDGVEDAEVFPDQSYTGDENSATPEFVGTPIRDGYTFIGWSPEVAETVTDNATYTAQWEANASTINFVTNGGTTVSDITGKFNDPVDPREMPTTTREHYEFAGWYDNASCTGTAVTQLPATFPNGDITYYAKWTAKEYPYTVKYVYEGGLLPDKFVSASAQFGQRVTSYTQYPADGYAFDRVENFPLTITGDLEKDVITVHYSKDANNDNIPDKYQATVIYKGSEGGFLTGEATETFTFGKAADGYQNSGSVTPTFPVTPQADAGYAFDMWTKDGSEFVKGTTIPNVQGGATIEIVAQFATDSNNDNTPDKYQAKVTYKIENGTWANGTDGDIVNWFDLKHVVNGTWVEVAPAPVLDDTVPEDMNPKANYDGATGTWGTPAPAANTPAVNGAVYTYSYGLNKYDLTVEYVDAENVSVALRDAFKQPNNEHGTSYNVSDKILVSLDANGKHYVLDSVEGNTTGTITGPTTIQARYAEDVNNDGTPDKYQATVTFNVVNGTFAGNFDRVQTLNFKTYDEGQHAWVDAKPQPVIPENERDMNADAGHHVGAQPWGDSDPNSATIEPGQPYEFTYTYVINTYTVTVEVENGTATQGPSTVNYGSDFSTSFTPNEGYALDTVTVDGKPAVLTDDGYTFPNISAPHAIKVVYAEDKTGTKDPDKGDGVPDKYQATVTYKVVNGTWDGTNKDDQVKVFNLKEKDPNGVWTELSPKLGGTVPTGMTALPAYSQSTGEWIDGTPVSSTPVTGNATYTYSYGNEMNKYKVTVEVENGTADSVSPIEVIYGSNKTIKFNGNEGYALDTVTVDGEPAVLDESGAYTFEDIQADRTIKVVYAEDKTGTDDPDEGDGIPDKYQATVTYKVVNGTWSDDTDEPQKNVFTIFEKNDNGEWNSIEKKLGGTVPTGMKPSQNHDANSGKWGDPAPTDATVVTQSTTYEYKFGLNKYTATVKYVDDSTAANKLAEDVVTDPIEHGQSYDVTNQIRASIDVDGTHYVLDTITGTVSGEITTDVTVTAVYAEDANNDGVPDKYEAAVTYKVKNGTWDGVVSSDKVEHFVLATKNADNTWTPTNAALGNTIPTGMQALPAYSQSQDKGAWDVSIKEDTPVVGDAIYTYSFGDELNSYPIDVTVVNGVANVELLAVENGHIQVMAEYGDDFVPSFAPAEGFALDAVTVDGQPAVLDANGAYEFKGIDGAHSITVTYAADANDDNIPDKYQATIVYTVDHGTWADLANEPIRNTVSFAQYNGETGQWDAVTPALPTVPTGMIPDAGYDQIGNGHWLVTPSMNGVQAGGTYTFPYSFDINTYGIDVRVVNGTSDAAAVGVTANYGDSRTYTFQPFAGYALDTVTVDGQVAELTDGTYTFSDIQGDHSIVATYAADANGDGVPDQYQAIANYNVVNGTWSNGTTAMISEYVDMFRYENGAWAAIQPVLNVPTGMIANDGYTQASGAWSVNPAVSQLVAGRAVTFTYGFTATPTVVVPPVAPVTPPTPPVTPAAVTPAPTPAPAPVATPAPAAAPAAVTPTPTATAIDDEATPLAAPEADEEQIADDGTPMGAFDEPHCWVHWVMLIGIILTAVYGILVVRRRLTLTSDIDDYEDQILGRADDAQTVPAHAAGHQAL